MNDPSITTEDVTQANTSTMLVHVNDREVSLPLESTVLDLLGKLGLVGKPVAVEKNATLVVSTQLDAEVLVAGDRLEIVTLTGGG